MNHPAETMNYHPLPLYWLGLGAIPGFLLSLDPHVGTVAGPVLSCLGSVAAVLVKWWLDRRRLRHVERIKHLEEENKALRAQAAHAKDVD